MNELEAEKECLDVFDGAFRHRGVASREQVHQDGLWHQTVHCWYAREEAGRTRLVLQRRHLQKRSNPGKFDVSVAGHLLAGEGLADVGRECEEELGCPLDPDSIAFLGTIPMVDPPAARKDFEFCHVFVARTDCPLTAYRPALDEVTGIYEIGLRDLRDLIDARTPAVEVSGFEVDAVGSRPVVHLLHLGELSHRSAAYYAVLWEGLARVGLLPD